MNEYTHKWRLNFKWYSLSTQPVHFPPSIIWSYLLIGLFVPYHCAPELECKFQVLLEPKRKFHAEGPAWLLHHYLFGAPQGVWCIVWSSTSMSVYYRPVAECRPRNKNKVNYYKWWKLLGKMGTLLMTGTLWIFTIYLTLAGCYMGFTH